MGALMISPAPHSFRAQEAHFGRALFDCNQSRNFCFCDSSRPIRIPFADAVLFLIASAEVVLWLVILLYGFRPGLVREQRCRVARGSSIAAYAFWTSRRVKASTTMIRFLFTRRSSVFGQNP